MNKGGMSESNSDAMDKVTKRGTWIKVSRLVCSERHVMHLFTCEVWLVKWDSHSY